MKKFISDVKKELNDLLAEKEANREMKLIKRLADKKILLSFIIGVFLIVTIFVNLISNSIDGMFLMLAGGESNFNILFNLFMPNLGYPLLYLFAYGIMTLVLIKFIFNFRASFKDISEGQKGTSRFTTMEEIKEQPEVTKKEKKAKDISSWCPDRRFVQPACHGADSWRAGICLAGQSWHAGRFKPFQVAIHFYTGTSLLL